jgi:acyl-CoA reductase-like NAD-dependent aldehyde dehydrogenase
LRKGRLDMALKRVRNYIDGQWVESGAKEYGDVWCPATGDKIGEVPFGTAEDIDKAVQAAKKAYWEWRCTPPLTRARYFFKLKELFENAFEDISRTLVTEEGKTLDESRGEVRRMIENVEHATGVTTMMTGYNLEDRLHGGASADRGFWSDRAIQLPGHGALVVSALCGGSREYVCSEAVGAGSDDADTDF